MPVIRVEPTDEHPVPFSTDEEKPKSLLDEIAVAGNTAELLVNLGAPLGADEDVAKATKKLKDAVTKGKTKNLNEVSTAFGAAAFLRQYGQQLALDANQVRAAITFKLMELANYGDPKIELKALELLGKHSDISLFSSKSEITINYKNPEDLENAIKERVKRLMNADVIDMVPLGKTIEEELAHFDHNRAIEINETEEAEEEDESDEDAAED
jgi:exopolyphosphatase/pppGpp-phosphohydrolase